MTDRESTLVDRLREAKSPRPMLEWDEQDGYYVTACRVSPEDTPGLIELARKWVEPDWVDDADEYEDLGLLPVTAWRTLADLKAEAAVEPLIDMLCQFDDEFDDWVAEDLPHVFGKIGPVAAAPLTRLAADGSQQEFVRSIAARGLGRVAHYHPDQREGMVARLTELMAGADHVEFNTALLVALVDLHAVEAAEQIERAFAGNLLDVGMMGDWEDVRRKLGVQGMGLKMPAKPYNSLEVFRRRMGVGIFSDRPIFMMGELDEDAAERYYERADNTFSKSDEARQAIERYGSLQWFPLLLEFGLHYLCETVDEMTPGSVGEFLFDYVPRKVSTEADAAESLVAELTLFWQYLDRVYQLPEAKSIVARLQTDGLTAEVEAELSDSSNFGMAKSIIMMGKDAGYDTTSEAGLAQLMAAYNQSLLADGMPAAMPPAARGQRVGRNDPCPCGSGKKFKKCCGHPSRRS